MFNVSFNLDVSFSFFLSSSEWVDSVVNIFWNLFQKAVSWSPTPPTVFDNGFYFDIFITNFRLILLHETLSLFLFDFNWAFYFLFLQILLFIECLKKYNAAEKINIMLNAHTCKVNVWIKKKKGKYIFSKSICHISQTIHNVQ